MTYLWLNISVAAVAYGWFKREGLTRSKKKAARSATVVVGLLSVVFDPLIVAAGIVAYNFEYTLGVQWFGAPIEDLFYTIAAGLIIPVLWKIYDNK